ncbi:MAG: hypothetical protein ACO3SO_01545 [Luteolibacter sp.]
MNRLKHRITRICLIFGVAHLSSCLDVREEFWIRKDGSAEAEITCQLPRTATIALGGPTGVRSMVEKLLEDEGHIDSYEVQASENGKRVILKVRCGVDQLIAFDNLHRSIQKRDDLHPAFRKMMGEFDIGIEGLAGVSVQRRVAPGEAVPAMRWLPQSQTKGHRIIKIIHFPQIIKQHNAHESWNKGCTLMWETSLEDAIRTPIDYQFVIPFPIPWGWLMSVAICVIAILAIVIQSLRRRSPGKRQD